MPLFYSGIPLFRAAEYNPFDQLNPSSRRRPMKRLALVSVVVAAGFAVAGSDEDVKKMTGKWRLVSFTRDGKATPQEVVASTRTVFEADGTYTVRRDGQVAVKAKVKLDASKNPKHTDVEYVEGELKGKTVLGIYKLEGDTATFCHAPPGQPRPTEFASKPGTGHVLIVNKRDQ
jgi:uncharacterized protein (TIGR03067 family)